ncbi:MAG: ribosome maturation factor RimM [Gammaproteobacteria bacterium]|nr:ribosome maturation factor RimM [Gammaproteobacteria bacterium]NNL06649.1 ribosome maturation factor RimM [Gammaproteobacteria bacterium]
MSAADEKLIVGKISGVYGVKGWVKVHSDTEPREGITNYSPWYLQQGSHGEGEWRQVRVEQGRRHAKTVIAKLEHVDDRDAAMLLAGAIIAISAEQLPAPGKDEFYWRDLVGLRVINMQGIELGTVQRLMETGANDVLVVGDSARGGREHLVPWTPENAVLDVDLENGLIRVDWDEDF